MADLAGFDLIGELHLDTIVDLIDLIPFTNPVDGKSIYLLGGPFSTDLNANLGSLGTITVRAVLNVKLEAVVHQPLARLVVSLTGSTSIANRSLSHLGGQVTISVPLGFATPPSAAPAGPQVPVFLLSAGDPHVVLDATTRSQADAALGKGGADRLTSGIEGAIATLLAAAGNRSIPAMGFSVVPGVNSSDPLQLSATPVVAWIDETTLAVFGYYRVPATGGDVNAKRTSDIVQTEEEFFYDQPGVVSVLAGRRVALVMSADAFQMVVVCPALRNRVVRSLVEKREEQNWILRIRNRDGEALLEQETKTGLLGHFIDELAKDPAQQTIAADFERARADVQADADAIIIQRAHAEEDAWLDTTPEGQQAITEAIPPPCGKGSVQMARQSVPHAQSDLLATLRRFQMALAKGRVAVHYDASASLEIIVGDVAATVSGDIDIFITTTFNGFVAVSLDVKTPVVNVTGTGLTGDIVDLLVTTGNWPVIMAYLGFVLQQTLRDMLAKAFPTPQLILVGLPQDTIPMRMAEVKIEPESLTMIALVCRHLHWNEFNPGLLLDATVERTRADEPVITGAIKFPATEWGCKAASFDTQRTIWNTTVSVRGRLRDAPLPVTVLGWQIEIGNFSVNAIGTAHLLDPRPTWSGEPASIVAGHLTLTGKVNHPDPPLILITGPSALGHLKISPDISVDVIGDPDKGWKLGFRGIDGNFYVRLSLDLLDGDSTQWHGETFVIVQGDQLELPSAYAQYKADCDAKYSQWFRLKLTGMGLTSIAQVQPGEPVMSGETREAIAIQTLILAGDPAAMRQLAAGVEKFGTGLIRQVGRVSGVPLVLPQGGKRLA